MREFILQIPKSPNKKSPDHQMTRSPDFFEICETLLGGFAGAVGAGVEFDGQEVLVVDGLEGLFEGLPVEGALAGDEVVVFAVCDVFDVAVPDAACEEVEGFGDRFADDYGVADVEVGAELRGGQAVDEFSELVGVFDEEAGLGFDADFDLELFGEFEEGF